MVRETLTREEVIKVIERKGGTTIPLVFHKWWGDMLIKKHGSKLEKMAQNYPDDIFVASYLAPGGYISSNNNMSYRWGYMEDYSSVARHSIGQEHVLLPDWSQFELLLEHFPKPNEPGNFDNVIAKTQNAGNRYKLGHWWRLFHERFWSIRGMENLMIDYYENMDKLIILGQKILDFYKGIIDKYADLGFDGIFTSDDLGHQTGLMMSPAIFKELYFPLYKEFISYVHKKGMHVFLHSCGDNTDLMPYLIEAGLDVFHPIQTGCMDIAKTGALYGDKISFLAGVDVQHLLPEGNVKDVRMGVRKMIDELYKPQGGLLLAAGNGILPDTPFENIEAMLNEMSLYKP